MVLGKLPVPGRPTILMTVVQGPIVLAVGAGGGCLDIFTLIYPFSFLSPSLWEVGRQPVRRYSDKQNLVFSQGGHTKHRREWNTRTVPGLSGRRPDID